MTPERYRLSFTTGGLFVREAVLAAKCYLDLRDWALTRAKIREGNLLQVRTAAAATRISKELIARLELLGTSEVEFLVGASAIEQAYLLWSAACRRYTLIRDFAQAVLRENYLLMRRKVTTADYDTFFSAKALWHAELDALAVSTQHKLRQNLFRMLREANLLSDDLHIQPATLTPALARLLAQSSREYLLVFPTAERELRRWAQ